MIYFSHFPRLTILLFQVYLLLNCSPPQEPASSTSAISKEPRVELQTSEGQIVIALSNKTPLHRDQFLKMARAGLYDSMLFHRVINDFVIQAGEFDSLRQAHLGPSLDSILNPLIPAEIDTSLFHKRGVLMAPRTDNVYRASVPLGFAIVQRGPRPDSLLSVDEQRINGWLKDYAFIHDPVNIHWKERLLEAEAQENEELFAALKDSVRQLSKSFPITHYQIPDHHKAIYRSIGGTAHLDQNYTVFGEVISGMDVVDKIAKVAVGDMDRPLQPVYVLKARVLEE